MISLKEIRFNKDVKKILEYLLGRTIALDKHMNQVYNCSCSECEESLEIDQLIKKVCE